MVVPEMVAPGGPSLNAWLIQWCQMRLKTNGSFGLDAVSMGVADEKDNLLCVTVFDNFRKGRNGQALNIECAIAADSPRWANRGTIRAILHYPFCQLKVQRMTLFVAESNARSFKLTQGLGFKVEGMIREALEGGENLHVLGMLREESRRWLGDLLGPKPDQESQPDIAQMPVSNMIAA